MIVMVLRIEGNHRYSRAFKQRRLAAAAEGKHFMTYGQACRRLERSIAEVAAGGVTAGIVMRVFGG